MEWEYKGLDGRGRPIVQVGDCVVVASSSQVGGIVPLGNSAIVDACTLLAPAGPAAAEVLPGCTQAGCRLS